MIRFLKIVILIVIIFTFNISLAQDLADNQVDSVEQESKKDKNLKFSILGGPGYTPDFGALIGGSALFTFKTDPTDSLINRSNVPVGFAWLFNGGFNAIVRPQLFFNEDKFRIFGQFYIKDNQENYYGVGFETNKERPRGEATTQYAATAYQFNPIFLFRLGASDFFLGPQVDITSTRIRDPAELMVEDPYYIAAGGTAEGDRIFNSGLGFQLSYDTRDFPANAYSGVYFIASAVFYEKFFGSDYSFQSYQLEYRQYKALPFLGERRNLAWTVSSNTSTGNVPWTDMSKVGSPFDLRGYYLGQFRDKTTSYAILEYRHMLNFDHKTWAGRFFSKFGFAAWCGVGAVGPTPFDVEGWLPNYGAGLRIEVQPRMNFRMDIGKDPINNQTLLYFNMTEAF
ncbi:BamA/TamA family outer membrane protein [Persicobacter sp. CCB-QB2]|uniref:BamA/TamA family outer membrane protein n=1 Tax=Persicobacter sp. CCB-QB2 TaxID=1561025 RepID=UPI0006A9F952|nr:BamA/TamA family outer membrane protein [Persicobacter sp. CCB-QB2]